MARRPSPWYWHERQLWMVNIDGVRHTLGSHPPGYAAPRRSKKTNQWNAPDPILDRFHELRQQGNAPVDGKTVHGIFQSFHNWNKQNRAMRTAERYFDFLDSFDQKYPGLTVADLKPSHVSLWVDEHNWNSTTKRNAITAIQRALNWGVRNMGIHRNPIKGMEKPEAKRRTVVITPQEFEDILVKIPLGNFRDILIVSYDTGARPVEIKRLEARHVQLDKQRAVIPAEEAKGRIPRAVYFPSERSVEIVKRLMGKHPTGPLFRNDRGNAWTGAAVKNAFVRFEEKIGKRITHYSLRHSFVTRSSPESIPTSWHRLLATRTPR